MRSPIVIIICIYVNARNHLLFTRLPRPQSCTRHEGVRTATACARKLRRKLERCHLSRRRTTAVALRAGGRQATTPRGKQLKTLRRKHMAEGRQATTPQGKRLKPLRRTATAAHSSSHDGMASADTAKHDTFSHMSSADAFFRVAGLLASAAASRDWRRAARRSAPFGSTSE